MQTNEPYYAVVASIGLMEEFFDRRLLSPYHLILAHKVLEEPERWSKFYKDVRRRDGAPFIIVDNSLVELDEALEADDLVISAGIVKANVVVLPDVFEEPEATVAYSTEAAEAIRKRKRKIKIPDLMGVVQGKTRKDALDCTEGLQGIEGVSYLAVPRVTVDNLGSRTPLSKLVWEKTQLPIHLLGFSKDLKDDMKTVRLEGVIGIDSSLPVSLAMRDEQITLESSPGHRHRPHDFLERDGKTYNEQMALNIAEVYKWMK